MVDGGRVIVCTQCAARRGILEGDLRAGVTIAGAAVFAEQILGEGVQALVY
ncbi:DsrE family protein [Nocardioides sp.]|uniref:DsrE family protein n=1 Tax=Nocardioides sp. TaxID=35761 RepID=UPI00286D7459|nr:DsrE family protein [Nocardioides sp.]